MGRKYIIAFFILVNFLSIKAWACTCQFESLAERVQKSDLVFFGVAEGSAATEAESIISMPRTMSYSIRGPQSVLTTDFKVTRPIKGRMQGVRRVIHREGDGANCGLNFEVGTEYVVFANKYDGEYYTSICVGTGPSESFDDEYSPEALKERLKLLSPTDPIYDSVLEEYGYAVMVKGFIQSSERLFSRLEARLKSLDELDGLLGFLGVAEKLEGWGDYENLADSYVRALKLAPKNPLLYYKAGEAFLNAGELKKAKGYFQQAIKLEEDHVDAQIGLAKTTLLLDGVVTKSIAQYNNLRDAKLNLKGEKVKSIDLSNSSFLELIMDGFRSSNLHLKRSIIREGSFKASHIPNARFDGSSISPTVSFEGSNLRDARFDMVSYSEGDFSGANLSGVSAVHAYLFKTKFNDSVIREADFSGAVLEGASFKDAKIGDVKFTQANLLGVNLQGTDLRKADFTGAKLKGVLIDCKTKLPRNVDVKEHQIIPVEAVCGKVEQNRDFSNQNWASTDFINLDLSGAMFDKNEFDSSSFEDAILTNASFRNVTGYAYFNGADLSGASFEGASGGFLFSGFTLDGQIKQPILKNVDFSKAILDIDLFYAGINSAEDLTAMQENLESANFSGTEINCTNDFHRNVVDDYEKTPRSFSYLESEKERLGAKKAEQKRYEYSKKIIQYETRLVSFLSKKWPSATFNADCTALLKQ